MDQTRACIGFWLSEYEKGLYVRLAPVEKPTRRAAGTVEAFGGECGVLRVDLALKCKYGEVLEEILVFCAARMIPDSSIGTPAIKAAYALARLPTLKSWALRLIRASDRRWVITDNRARMTRAALRRSPRCPPYSPTNRPSFPRGNR